MYDVPDTESSDRIVNHAGVRFDTNDVARYGIRTEFSGSEVYFVDFRNGITVEYPLDVPQNATVYADVLGRGLDCLGLRYAKISFSRTSSSDNIYLEDCSNVSVFSHSEQDWMNSFRLERDVVNVTESSF